MCYIKIQMVGTTDLDGGEKVTRLEYMTLIQPLTGMRLRAPDGRLYVVKSVGGFDADNIDTDDVMFIVPAEEAIKNGLYGSHAKSVTESVRWRNKDGGSNYVIDDPYDAIILRQFPTKEEQAEYHANNKVAEESSWKDYQDYVAQLRQAASIAEGADKDGE